MLGMGVDGDGPTELASDRLGHERHPRRAADEQDRVDVAGADPGGRNAAAERPQWLDQRGAIICSNSPRVRRTSDHTPGRATGTTTSLSSDSPSFAVTHS